LVVVADGDGNDEIAPMTGKTAGFDFGLKTFLTTADGEQIDLESPSL
jgi:putative transposase